MRGWRWGLIGGVMVLYMVGLVNLLIGLGGLVSLGYALVQLWRTARAPRI